MEQMTPKQGNSDEPRILIVDLAVSYGGTSSRILNLLEKLPPGQAGLASLAGSQITQRALGMGFDVHEVGRHKADPFILKRMIDVIRANRYQVLDTQNVQSKFWGSMAAAFTGAALVSTLNSWYLAEHGPNLKGRVYQTIEFASNRKLDLYITVSTVDHDRVLAEGVPAESVRTILNAIEINPADVPGDKDWLRETFALPDDAVVCSAVGRLVWQKGYEDLIDAFVQIADKHPNLYCLILGEGDLYDELTERIARTGLQDRCRLLGFRPREEVLSSVKASDIFVMPSRYEGTPVALLEAAALARPILATRAGGIPDLVSDGEQALLVNVGDSGALAAGLDRLSGDPELAQRLGAQAQAHIVQHFSPQAQAEITWHAYQKAWERRQQRLANRAGR